MDVFADLVRSNDAYVAEGRHRHLSVRPGRQLTVLTCMDSRIDVFAILGLELGDAHVLRTAGGRLTDDALRSLTLSTHALGVRNVVVIVHTDCGVYDPAGDLEQRLTELMGHPPTARGWHTFSDEATAVAEDCDRLLRWPDRPDGLAVAGYVFDVRDGRLREVVAPTTASSPPRPTPPSP